MMPGPGSVRIDARARLREDMQYLGPLMHGASFLELEQRI